MYVRKIFFSNYSYLPSFIKTLALKGLPNLIPCEDKEGGIKISTWNASVLSTRPSSLILM